MKVCGVDQSFTSSGIIILDENGDIEFAEKYTSDPNENIFARSWEISTYFAEIYNSHKPDIVALEGLAFSAAGDQTRNLAGLQFVSYCVLHFMEGVRVEIASPGTIKKFATGHGRANKDDMIESLPPHVREFFDGMGVKKTTGLTDLSDAYFIAKYYQSQKE